MEALHLYCVATPGTRLDADLIGFAEHPVSVHPLKRSVRIGEPGTPAALQGDATGGNPTLLATPRPSSNRP